MSSWNVQRSGNVREMLLNKTHYRIAEQSERANRLKSRQQITWCYRIGHDLEKLNLRKPRIQKMNMVSLKKSLTLVWQKEERYLKIIVASIVDNKIIRDKRWAEQLTGKAQVADKSVLYPCENKRNSVFHAQCAGLRETMRESMRGISSDSSTL